MPIARFGSGKPAANTNLLLYTVTRSSLISVVAVNLSGATKITSWIVPNTQEESPNNWIYFGNQIPLTSRNTFETFKTSVNVGDKVYVKSESGNVSFFVNGIYDTTGTTDVSVGTEPTNPQVGTLWINTSFDPARVFYWDGEDWVDVGIQGDPGTPNTLTVGTVASVPSVDPPTVTITGESPNQVINFEIPEGLVGPANTLTVGEVTAVGPEENPVVTIEGNAPSQTINFALPQGIQGPPGDLGTATLGDLQDVTITGDPTEGSILVYNETLGQWENTESSGNIPDLNMVIMGAY
jgi:hypothetical protein